MEYLTDITDIRTIQWLVCSTSCILAFILLIIKVPKTEYSKRLATAKNTVALSFLVCAFLMGFTIGNQEVSDYDIFSSLTMLTAASFSTMAISYSMIRLLNSRQIESSRFSMNVFLGAVGNAIMLESFISGHWTRYIASLIFSILLFIIQSIYYIIMFDRAYKSARKELEAYYDDDEDHKLRWIRFCYILAMLVDIFLLVYLLLPRSFMKVYIAWYILYLLYFTGNFISFLGSHKLTLDAFAHSVLSGQELMDMRKNRRNRKAAASASSPDTNRIEKEFTSLEKRLGQWVQEKRYREYDNSREEVAEQLHTTKETLQLYFSMKIGKDFRTWRTELRIEDAKKMILSDQKLSINQIGEICGFSDRSNFHRQFTKIVGCSPKKWRETDGKAE